MTTPTSLPVESPRAEWWTRPGVVLPVVCSVALLVALLTPQAAASGRFGDPRLTTHLANSLGAKVLYELAGRFGWKTVQQDSVGAPQAGDGRTSMSIRARL